MTISATIQSIYRYPVKGLSPERLPHVALTKGGTLPNDRRYAIENGPSGFDPASPQWKSKTYYFMLMRDERLAALRTQYDDASHVLTVSENGREAARGDLESADGRTAIEAFFRTYCEKELKGPPKVLASPGYSFSDVPRKVVSIINLASVAALDEMVGQPVDPLRFRGNLHVTGLSPWAEFDLLDKTLTIGSTRLQVNKRIVRCAAINVDPVTAARDMNLPHMMMHRLGHMDCGVYAEVVQDGAISEGDAVSVT